ncbi:UDP-N-acetylmuramate:L-alanyl-gamma-D-glutamyl-meso-diaminopimelate ligase [Sansalvadorimonas sp. 2012CJ34-2]|uniref:UDP-N-acetylmuramate--L-alanyl-gamma-D-glutamyl-meso-2,6-diaminoheptandioate ligase n=1 Tax=Parendozoicomonas callyspongiae TaxID=2942213 RepID=A0ABT0PCH5_9GAMM|nr:UDP-N-acetylmuramate:L-alanyl-gamma-D-glutamyl-meso-diaminopimelate ligase [Sansalvadorimonas sp. 2012CJ34-2]MCL6269088.1 UDP-N-acetylmuramate:L-alanyl-gamma-D-glutamyl-meso-diaminopimelate ligase [Sansalvadorimonas sp. 2012CJ34-2]
MHIHILGICGTFMGSLALLAKEVGHRVTGSDRNVYPPMSTQLEEQGIALHEGYDPEQLDPAPDMVVVGNAMTRGNPAVEYLLDKGFPYTSGPQFLADHILSGRWVLAAAGTHGKTTTSTMLAWILEYAGMAPGFLIGGVPGNFGISARLGDTPFFVIEADEYDTAFFDKRSKFVHYHPRTAILNNLEFDHADIFGSLADIQRQFHHLVRIVPGTGQVIAPVSDNNLDDVLEMGCWSEQRRFGEGTAFYAEPIKPDCSEFRVFIEGKESETVSWSHTGEHNRNNALAAILAARHVGVTPAVACEALCQFKGVKRRMELLAETAGVKVYDDFAHHPTAIATTLEGLRARVGDSGVIRAVIEPRSNTMKMGIHKGQLAAATAAASAVIWFEPDGLGWSLTDEIAASPVPATKESSIDNLVNHLVATRRPDEHLVIMSNGGFGGLHKKLVDALNGLEE